MTIQSRIILAALGLALASAAAIGAPNPPDELVAKGNGFEIRRGEMDEIFARYQINAASPDQPFTLEAQVQILNQLIEMKLVMRNATDSDKIDGKTQGDENFDKIVDKFPSPADFEKRVKQAGLTDQLLHDSFTREGIAMSALIHNLGITVTDDQVQQFFDSQGPGAYDKPLLAHVREIVILNTDKPGGTPLPPDQLATQRDLADAILKRARTGEDFTALARQFSQSPNAKDTGGELPPFAHQQLEIAETAFTLKLNGISDVLTCADGFHIVKLLNLIPPHKTDISEVADNIKKYLTVKQVKELGPAYLAKLRADSGIEILDPDLKAAMTPRTQPTTQP